jgi:hypothetical protein
MSITAGQTVQYTNRKGTVMTGEVVEVLPAEVFGEPLAVVVWLDGPAKGMDQRKKLTELAPVAR